MIAALLVLALGTTATTARDLTALIADCRRDPKGCATELDAALVLADEAQTAREDLQRRIDAGEAALASRDAELAQLRRDLFTVPTALAPNALRPPAITTPPARTPWFPLFTAITGAAAGAAAGASGCDLFGCKPLPAIGVPAIGAVLGAIGSCLIFGCSQ